MRRYNDGRAALFVNPVVIFVCARIVANAHFQLIIDYIDFESINKTCDFELGRCVFQ